MAIAHPPSPAVVRHWRISIPISLGVVLLLASLVIAAMSLRSHAGHGSSPNQSPATPADSGSWMSLGYVDIEGGITPLYPVQPGRVQSIEAVENQPLKAGQPIFHLEDKMPQLKVKEAEEAVQIAKDQLATAQARLQQANEQIDAQQKAVAAAEKQVDKARLAHDRLKRLQKADLAGGPEALKSAELDVERAELGVQGEKGKLSAFQAGKREAEGLIAVARGNIKLKQTLLDEAQNAVKETVVRAPCDGTPLRILVNVGQVLGTNPQQPAVQFKPDRPLLVRAEVEQEFASRVHKDDSVDIADHATGEVYAHGKVVSLALWYAPRRTDSTQLLQMNNDVRTLECIVKIESFSKELRVGQRVRVQFPN